MVQTAFVLGGGGYLGACEVGMLRALLDCGIRPDLVLGTSVGAVNGAAIAADPSLATVDRLDEMWGGTGTVGIFQESTFSRMRTAMLSRTHLHSNASLRRVLEDGIGADTLIEDLAVPFQCVAASIERAAEHWFSSGPVVEAVLASCAVPGLLPPVPIGDEHFLDGGLVDSVPVGRAAQLGAELIYVLQVGRIEQPLTVPQRPWEVAAVAFEIARRHRYARDLAALPDGVTVHVLPTGVPPRPAHWSQYTRYRDFTRTQSRISAAYEASRAYLESV